MADYVPQINIFLTNNAFTFTVVTSGINDTFTLPIYNGGIYDFGVDWGDGNSDFISEWDSATKTHTYTDSGTYEVNISGTINGWRFNVGGDKDKLYEIKAWGPLNLGNSGAYFYGCSNLTVTATDTLDLTDTTNLSNCFRECTILTTVPSMNSWDTSKVTTMSDMFHDASLFNGNISGWDTSKVTTMSNMFQAAVVFNQDLNNWNVSAVVLFDAMFRNATLFDGNISNWVTSAATNMRYMFWNAITFNQDIGNWDLSKVTRIDAMFNNARLFNQDISGWDVSKVELMGITFEGARLFNQDITGWNTSSVINMYGMFRSAAVFDQNISGWDITLVTDMTYMFLNVTLSIPNYDALLIGWEAQAVQNNVNFHGGNSQYSSGSPATARQALIDDHLWTITDGGQA